MYNRLKYCFLLFGISLLAACHKDNGGSTPSPKLDQEYYGRQAFIVGLNGNYIVYDSAIKVTGLADTLLAPGPFTTIVPDNSAMGAVYWGYAANGLVNGLALPSNAAFVLRSLIISGSHPFSALPVGRNQSFTSLTGNHLYISKYAITPDSMVYVVNGVRVVTPDYPTTNGPLQVVDSLIPNLESYATVTDYVHGDANLTYLSLALKRTGLDQVLAASGKAWTLLAPSDAAFRSSTDPSLNSYDGIINADTARLARILRYHIIPDRDFLFDFRSLSGNADTLQLNTLQNEPVSVFFSGPYGSTGYFFIGPGNWTQNGSSAPVANFANLYQVSYPFYIADRITGNGTIHELDRILIP
jgi:uncharacterized surface protein with fasciclin (FAS1) repeats